MFRILGHILLTMALVLCPVPSKAGEVVLYARDLVRMPLGIWLAPGFRPPEPDVTLPVVGDGARFEEAARLLRERNATVADRQLAGIVYDNRDRGHSVLARELFPWLTHLVYDLALQSDGADYGLAGSILLPAVVLGNSSTAIRGGPAPRSLTRLAMTRRGLAERAARLYEQDHLYVYPEHRDHDEADLFPANWPYTLTSQGSSGSDQPLLEALAMTLAAMHPETFARAREQHLVASTLQMILRRSLRGVESREDYLSGLAHPVVFDAVRLRPERMVELAGSLGPADIPPRVRLDVIEEDFTAEAGLARLSERLFDTPAAIARIWRGFEHERVMIVSAEQTVSQDGRPLRFDWSLLQGDPERVRIEPLDPEGRRARITLAWHDAFKVGSGDASRETSRVDIGVFASDGRFESAPAFVSVSFPSHEVRLYGPADDGTQRLVSVDYDAIARGVYFDPELHWSAAWRDDAVYDDRGERIAWTRSTSDGVETIAQGSSGEPAYVIDRTSAQTPVLRSNP